MTLRVSKSHIVDTDNSIWIDSNGALPIFDVERRRAYLSKQFFVSHRWTNVPDGTAKYLHFKTPSTMVDLVFTTMVSGEVLIDLFENPSLSDDGTELSIFCTNRENPTTTEAKAYIDPSVTSEGTCIETTVIGSPGKFTLTGGIAAGYGYWYLKSNTSYLSKIKNVSGSTTDIAVAVTFFVT